MRRSVFIAGLAAALVLGMGVFGSGTKRFQARAQQNPSSVEIDRQLQFWTDGTDRPCRDDGDVDQS